MSGTARLSVVAILVSCAVIAGCKSGGGGGMAARKSPAPDPFAAGANTAKPAARKSSRKEIPALESPRNALYETDRPDTTTAQSNRPQHTCPIDGIPLGYSGTPVTVTLRGEPIFVCSQGCANKAQQDPDKYLSRVRIETAARE